MADYNHVFEDFEEDLRSIYADAWDRFGCECGDFDRCPFPGHTDVGKCRLSDEWRAESDECDAYD